MLKVLDLALCVVAIGVGVLHSFIVAPQVYDAFAADAFWFFAAGLSIVFAGLLNLLRAFYGGRVAALRWAALFASLLLFLLILAFAVSLKAAGDPMVALQALVYGGLVAMALFRPHG